MLMKELLREAGHLEAEVVAYTDGSCHPNPGPGGWAAILLWGSEGTLHEHVIAGGVERTTNNRMEIQGVLEALRVCHRPVDIIIYSDSKYVVQSIGPWQAGFPDFSRPGWIERWKANGWRKSDNEDVKNKDLWEDAWSLCERHKSVEMRWVKGHKGIELNERCDVLAVEQKKIIRKRLQSEKRSATVQGNGKNT